MSKVSFPAPLGSRGNERYQYPDINFAYVLGKRLTVGELGIQNRFGGSIPLKTAERYTVQLGSFAYAKLHA
ncbi:MAG: hypothetical protein ISR78_01320 [Spirochaetia bacterium]|nr:hypothetical protein [Spirochaetia bacterium]